MTKSMAPRDQFRALLRDRVEPVLRDLGWTGGGLNWTFPDETFHVLLGVQKSVWNDSSEFSFTINLLVCTKADWRQSRAMNRWLSPRLTANAVSPGIPSPVRIGELTGRGDLWFTLPSTGDVAGQVERALRQHVMPYVERRLAG